MPVQSVFGLLQDISGVLKELSEQDKRLMDMLALVSKEVDTLQGELDKCRPMIDWVKAKMDDEKADAMINQLKH